ncbi:MAG: 23S rRNA (guanosine(2251)-2'-O)-methyltransferase RlmB [Desulfobulbaceae bacterium]|nr:23S rRNA (guanosine(2251)-2'-O)-methyltransferase RlmB [Desulfobulbaceae bacterium]
MKPQYRKTAENRRKNIEGAKNSCEDLLWGINSVAEALAADPRSLSEVLVQRGKAGPRYQEIIDGARAADVRLRFVEADRLGVPPRTKHQGVVARLAQAPLLQLDELLSGLEITAENPCPRILAVDSVQDPRNLGAILRSALAAGFGSVILTRERSVPLTGTVARTSAGAVSHLRICQIVNLAETLKLLRQNRFWIFGTVADQSAMSLYDVDFSVPLCLVVGSEGKGIRPLVQKQCDQLITIPMQGSFNSLNASVAAAVTMFEVERQQTKLKRPHGAAIPLPSSCPP